MTSAAQPPADLARHEGEGSRAARFAGLTFAALFPACVWMVIASQVSEIVGYELEAAALLAFGSAVALFMVSACAPIMLRD